MILGNCQNSPCLFEKELKPQAGTTTRLHSRTHWEESLWHCWKQQHTNHVSFTYHISFLRVVETLQQLDTGALTTATTSNKSQSLSRLNSYSESFQDLNIRSRRVREFTVKKFNASLEIILVEKKNEKDATMSLSSKLSRKRQSNSSSGSILVFLI